MTIVGSWNDNSADDEVITFPVKITSDCDCNVVTLVGDGITDFTYDIPFTLPNPVVSRTVTFTETEVGLNCLDFSIDPPANAFITLSPQGGPVVTVEFTAVLPTNLDLDGSDVVYTITANSAESGSQATDTFTVTYEHVCKSSAISTSTVTGAVDL